jgi:hypothetical protein
MLGCAVAPASTQPPTCVAVAPISVGAPAPREETFRQVTALHDCIARKAAVQSADLPVKLAFWPGVLDILMITLGAAALVWAARRKPIPAGAVGALASLVIVLALGRAWLHSGLQSYAATSQSRQFEAAETSWQLDMVRARQTSDSGAAADLAIKATERFVTATRAR